MNRDDYLKKIPREGLLKIGRDPSTPLSSSQKTALIRKGNELYNAGQVEQAKRVFITAGYGDGIGRVGDYYLTHNNVLEALRMYWMAPAPDKVGKLLERMTGVIRSWLQEDVGTDEKRGNGRD